MQNDVTKERTLVVIKPDAVKRALIGKIITKFEGVGLKLIALKMIQPTEAEAIGNYPLDDDAWVKGLGEKTLNTLKHLQLDPQEIVGKTDPVEIGKDVVSKLVSHWTSGPVVVMVWQGPHAVEIIRKLRGVTTPLQAEPGSLLGDMSFDSQVVSLSQQRAMRTFVHATGSKEEADREIAHWFSDPEIVSEYTRTDHYAML